MTGAVELAMACATLGLVLGGLIGGPVARHLLKKFQSLKALNSKKKRSLKPSNNRVLNEKLMLIMLLKPSQC